jgi:sugar phosphate permease
MHIVLWGFSVLFFIYQYGARSSVPNVLNNDLQQYFGVTAAEMGRLIGLFFITYTAMQIPVGILIDRLNVKLISVIACLSVALGMLAFVWTNSYQVASLAQLLIGFGASFAFVLVIKVSNDFFPREKVAFISSIGISCGSLGPVSLNLLIANLAEIYPWKNIVCGIGIFGIIIVIIGYLAVDMKKLPKPTDVNHSAEKQLSIKDSIKVIISNIRILLIGIFSMTILGPVSAFCDAWGVSFMQSIYEVDKVAAASAVSMIYLGTMFGAPIAAYLSEKLKSYRKVMLGGSVILVALFGTVIFVKLNFTILCILFFIIGIAATCQFLSFPAALALTPKKIGATVTGVVNTVTMLGSTILVPIIGEIIDFSKNYFKNASYTPNDYKNGMLMIIVSIVLGMFTLFFIKDGYHKDGLNKS